jgi:hypothetical protein
VLDVPFQAVVQKALVPACLLGRDHPWQRALQGAASLGGATVKSLRTEYSA